VKKKIKDQVTFYSPGTLFSEGTIRDIDIRDPEHCLKLACKMAKSIIERHSSKPYGFKFRTIVP